MVPPFCQGPKNSSKIKPLPGNAIRLNLLRMRTISTDQFPSTAKKSKRFSYALQSSWKSNARKIVTRKFDVFSSNENKETRYSLEDHLKDTQYDNIFTSADTDFVVQKKGTFKGVTDSPYPIKLQRKYRMRDEFGNLIRRVRIKNPVAKKAMTPESSNRHVVQRPNSLTLRIRRIKVGTLTKTFTGNDYMGAQCILTVDDIRIGNEGQIDASDVIACEWCTVQRLPALFLQTRPETHFQLQVQLEMFEEDLRAWCGCQSRNEKEKYVVLIFEKELTLPEQISLEEIFTEIGKRNGISCFPVKLSFEEANKRLKTHNCAQKREASSDAPRCEIATLSVSESDEEDDLIELPSSPKLDMNKLVVYTPPSANGGITVTEEDFNCPDEGGFLSNASISLFPPSDAPRREIATLSVSDSDEDDLIGLPSVPKLEIDKLVVYPPPPTKGGITITEEDFNCLDEGKFLNDVIIDFYLRYLVCKQEEMEDVHKYHVFSSFFFKHLTQKDHQRLTGTTGLSIQERRHNRVKTWTRNVNLFEKDFIFVPINQMAHWYLAVICFPGKISQTSGLDLRLNERRHSVEYLCDQSPPNPMSLFYSPECSKQLSRWSQSIDDLEQSFSFLSDDEPANDVQAVENRSVLNRKINFSERPCILIMDSLTCRERSSVVEILQQYLQEEWKVKMGSQQSFEEMNGWSPLVPKQDNCTDCGIFLLQYVESFLKDPPQTFHDNVDLKGWFSQRTVKKKRRRIKRLILKLHRQQQM